MAGTNIGRWIARIRDSSRRGLHEHTLHIFRQMLAACEDLRRHPHIIPTILRSVAATANLSNPRTAKSLHTFIYRHLTQPDEFICSALINLYCKCGCFNLARKVFDIMPHKDLVVWNSMVSGYANYGSVTDAMALFGLLQSSGGIKPDIITWNALISGFSRVGDNAMAMSLLSSMQIDGITPDIFSWTSVISGLVQNFNYNKAFEVFNKMVNIAKVGPNSVTISSLLPACANVMDLGRGKQMHGYAVATGMVKDLFVGSSLVDMYAKCGLICETEMVFLGMGVGNTVCYNSMIFAYANHGYCEESIRLFYQMENDGVRPDHMTFTGVFTACSHSGKVEFGRNLFNLMKEKYRIQPKSEHYACIVDLLGRAGKIDEAYNFINAMPVEPDSFVWGALLGACRKHGEPKLAEVAASRLTGLEPDSPGSSLLLTNILRDAGRWGDAMRTKKSMRRRKFESYRGRSWVKFD